MKRRDIPKDYVTGCYSVHLYCHHPNHDADYYADLERLVPENPREFIGRSEADCLRTARSRGWWIGRENDERRRAVLCPYHARVVPR